MSSPLPSNPVTVGPLLQHLTTWSEVASWELRSMPEHATYGFRQWRAYAR